jgi:dihydrofolate reductase
VHAAAFIATSLDGCIARADGALDWLPQDDSDEADDDHGYAAFVAGRDVIVMGRATYDTVVGFDVGWPYELPVVVLTHRPLADTPSGADVTTASGPVAEVLATLGQQGRTSAYVDGGAVIQQLLAADLLDQLTITVVPVLLGDGIRLFGDVPGDRRFVASAPRLVAGGLVQTTWTRAR